MAKITSGILKKIAPLTPQATLDKFVPFLNDAMPRYDITTANQVRGFLASVAFESMYFQATKEKRARKGTKAYAAQEKYWYTGYLGRALLQVTHEDGYQDFQDDVGDAAGIDVMAHPELLEQPKWAVEASCHYWQKNRLNRYADKGSDGFAQLQGRINRGNPAKEAWGEDDRELVYKKCISAIPNNFVLDNSATASTVHSDDDLKPTPLTPTEDTPSVVADPPVVNNATNIIQTGDQTPPSPPPTDVNVPAPAPMGSVQSATAVTIGGFAVPTFLVAVWKAVTDLIDKGFIDAKDIGSAVVSLITNNGKYIIMGIGLVVLVIIVKKIERGLIFIVTIITHSVPWLNSINIDAPTAPAAKPFWKFW